jgi:YVTN family beta-propeller protein
MPMSNCLRVVAVAVVLAASIALLPPVALATRLPDDLQKVALNAVPGKVRLDGALESRDGALYLLLLPASKDNKKGKADIESTFASRDAKRPDIIFYSNGWAHARVTTRGEAATLAIPTDLNDKAKKKLLSLHFPSDLIVPQGFVLPRSMKALIQEVPAVALVDDNVFNSPDFGQKPKPVDKAEYKGSGSVFLTSITSGSITLLDGKTFNKLAEFPTEGTPCSMELANGRLYIADEAKNRLLVLDPVKRRFAGQIDLPPNSAPKGIVAPASGKWLYVSESGASDIAVVETATGRALLRTKVHPGPGRMALTPDGNFLLVLNVTSGEVSIISTYNHKVISTIKVGYMPSSLAISSDGKYAYVSNRNSDSISVIDVPHHTIAGTIKSGPSPIGVALSPDDKRLYVATGRDNTVTEYDTHSLGKLRELHLPPEMEFPGSISMLPGGRRFIVTSQGADSVAVIDAEKMELENRTALGHANHEVVWEPVP